MEEFSTSQERSKNLVHRTCKRDPSFPQLYGIKMKIVGSVSGLKVGWHVRIEK